MTGHEMIAEERRRQIAVEGFTFAHDDEHRDGHLVAAADCYLYLTHAVTAPEQMAGLFWPWHPSWFKPDADPRRNLVKAGALYLAEGERLDRARKKDQAQRCRTAAHRIAAMIDEME